MLSINEQREGRCLSADNAKLKHQTQMVRQQVDLQECKDSFLCIFFNFLQVCFELFLSFA